MKNKIFAIFCTFAFSVNIKVSPYLQDASPHEITIMWETDSNEQSIVEYGLNISLGNIEIGSSQISSGLSQIHTVTILNLISDTRYFYKVITDDISSEISNFITPPDTHDHFSFVAMSDMQRDNANPNKFEEVVHDGIISFFNDNYSGDISNDLGFVLIPGDLVPTGTSYSQWEDYFFTPATPLFSQVPVYPVFGNHEQNSDYFIKYFHLPENGSPGFEEHWWFKDYSNVRIIGLDSNWDYQIDEQLEWIDAVLSQSCEDDNIDFVFAELHHPHKSELWPAGETDFTGAIIEKLENFSTTCGKPSIHFFGHTHGYSRGQSIDHQHLWVNVATAGGNIDYWDEYAQTDYEEFTVSLSEYGFVVMDVETGVNPQFTMKRVSRGNEFEEMDNIIRDVITIRKFNDAPQTPNVNYPSGLGINPDEFTLEVEFFEDINNDEHWFSQWQIAESCNSFENPIIDIYESHENWYHNENTQAGNSLTEENMSGLEENSSYCWRVRFRDSGLKWSEWSNTLEFTTGESLFSSNLLLNPGAENGIEGWEIREGIFESLPPGDCAGINPNSGIRYFSVGGLCSESEYAEVYQSIFIGDDAECIDAGDLSVLYKGYLSNWNGADHPEFKLEFDDGLGNIIFESPILDTYNSSWTEISNQMVIPVNTRIINFVMMGTRYGGADNDSYFDDMEMRLLNNCNQYLIGDLNNDEIINVIDIIQMVNIILGNAIPTNYELQVGDTNLDGIINIIDVIQVVNLII
jgi:acid phosphatase type 7